MRWKMNIYLHHLKKVFFFFFPNQQPPKESRDYKNEQMVMHPSKCASCRPECLCQMLVL